MSDKAQEADNGPHFRGPFLDSETHLAILIPSGDSWNATFSMSLIHMLQAVYARKMTTAPQSVFVLNTKSSMLPYSRESSVIEALKQGATHILMLDSDMSFPPDTLHYMMWQMQEKDVEILIANYVKRTVPTEPITFGFDGKKVWTKKESTGIEKVRSGGLGVTLMNADVFRKVPRPWFNFYWTEEETGNPKINGEDTWLFDRCREHGFDCYVDHDLSKYVGHIGEFEYTFNMAGL